MNRTVSRSADLFARASSVIAGGVSSDARRVSGTPLYVDRAHGAHLWDVDGNRYVDYVLGQGPALLGHSPEPVVSAVSQQVAKGIVYSAQHEGEVQLAELICDLVPFAEQVRFNSVGSEAVHGALRLARGYTGRSKIIKFEGHYHGWLDPVLYSVHPDTTAAGSAQQPQLVPGTAGQQLSSMGDLVLAPWNDPDALRLLLERHGHQVAAVIMEPILCNSGAIMPEPGFLQAAVDMAHAAGALVIFDEIITGFRIAAGGASEYFGVMPDLATFGKAIAGGMPLSAIAGRREVMEAIASGAVAHAGTFNSHPVSVAAANAALTVIKDGGDALYASLTDVGQSLMRGLRETAAEVGVPMLVDGPGPVFQTYFTSATSVRNYRDFAATDRSMNARLQQLLLDRGVNLNSRGLWFLSTAHTQQDVDETIAAFADALTEL